MKNKEKEKTDREQFKTILERMRRMDEYKKTEN